LVDRLGALDTMVEPPEEWGFNHRLTPERAAKFFRARLRDAAGDPETWRLVRDAVRTNLQANYETVTVYAQAIAARYGDSYRAAIEQFGRWDREKPAAAA
jgi:hypothetical protein